MALDLRPGEGLYKKAYSHNFVGRKGNLGQLQLLALRLRSRMAFLRNPTPLHIFVVTLRCEHSCPYCQVSRRSADKTLYDMDDETAQRALDIALSAPGRWLKLEFQGGEPLLNFPRTVAMSLASVLVFASATSKSGHQGRRAIYPLFCT